MFDLKAREKKKEVIVRVEQASIGIQTLRNKVKTLEEMWERRE